MHTTPLTPDVFDWLFSALKPVPMPDMTKGIAVQHGKRTDVVALAKLADKIKEDGK